MYKTKHFYGYLLGAPESKTAIEYALFQVNFLHTDFGSTYLEGEIMANICLEKQVIFFMNFQYMIFAKQFDY